MCSSWILFVTDSILLLWVHVLQWHNWIWSSLQMPWLFLFWNNGSPYACLGERSLTWHGSCRWSLQLSPCIFNDVLVLFITGINRINSSQFSGVFEFWLLDCPYLFFSSLRSFSVLIQASGPKVIWTWCRLDFCQSQPRPHISFWKSFVQ